MNKAKLMIEFIAILIIAVALFGIKYTHINNVNNNLLPQKTISDSTIIPFELNKFTMDADLASSIINIHSLEYSSLANLPSNSIWLLYAFIFALAVIFVAALVYGISGITNSIDSKLWSKNQIYEAFLSIVMLIIFIGLISLFMMNPKPSYNDVGLLPYQCNTSSINTLFNLSACDLGTFNTYAYSVLYTTYTIGFASGLEPGTEMAYMPGSFFGNEDIFVIGMGLDSLTPSSTESLFGDIISFLLTFLILNELQMILLTGSLFFLIIFVSLGLVIRTLGFSRSFGGSLIALGLGLGLIYPLLISISYGAILNPAFVPTTAVLNSASSSSSSITGPLTTVTNLFSYIFGYLLNDVGYTIVGFTFLPFLNFIILDAFMIDFSSAIGEKISFMVLLSCVV